MTDTDAIPTVREELERKSLDEIVRLAQLVAQGRLSEGQYSLILRSVWTVVSGLIPEDSLALVAQAADQFPLPRQRATFFNAGDLYAFSWDPERDGVTCVRMGPKYAKPHVNRLAINAGEHAEKLPRMFDALKKSGWVVVP
jgi:hypothetical protein